MLFKVLYLITAIYISLFVLESFLSKRSNSFDYYFGVPGSGKTTFAAWLTKRRLKRKGVVYSNVAIKGALEVNKEDIGHYDISNGLLILDEASVDYNNRNFKTNFDDDQLYYFKHHRHYNIDISIFSQSWEDADITLRRLSTRYYYVYKSFIPFFITRRLIKKSVVIDKETRQVIEGYKYVFLGRRLMFAPRVWKMFQTRSTKSLPKKHFKKYI
ncbi:MAG: zonular occludens toxin domain-containing protein [Bacilli bacterium]|nr:zonular occludens toxin domain-containing protein [Bacilli bacterium]